MLLSRSIISSKNKPGEQWDRLIVLFEVYYIHIEWMILFRHELYLEKDLGILKIHPANYFQY